MFVYDVRRVTKSYCRYHLDSDHSSQHEERPEELARRILALPASSNRHSLLVQTSGGSTAYCQSSLEDTSDSLNADLEVCGILGATDENDRVSTLPRNLATIGKKYALDLGDSMAAPDPPLDTNDSLSKVSDESDILNEPLPPPVFQNLPIVNINAPASSKSPTLDTKLSATSDDMKKLEETGEKTLQPRNMNPIMEAHRKAFRAAGGKTPSSNLRIRICNKSPPKEGEKEKRPLETDSSNEYESETGLPKSPTLFISGVSISRTPEPKSPALAGRQSRSSSLTASLPPPPLSPLLPSLSVAHLKGSLNSLNSLGLSFLRRKSQEPTSNTKAEFSSSSDSPLHKQKDNPKSKSASEPEREREMFRFPKSSTDGALSSVLHIQESNLSSDDFHEALFLLERSPKSNQGSKRRKRSKKERQKDKENASSASIVVPEASSAL